MKKRLIAGAALAMIMSASMMAGATYAVFTSESTNDITVTAGKVDVKSTITGVTLKSKGVALEGTTFENGGTAEIVEGNKLVLNNVTPGDEVTVGIQIANNSNVAVKYRSTLACTTGHKLFNALEVTKDTPTWAVLPQEGAEEVINIKLPMLAEEQNELQGLNTEILLVVEAVQGNGEKKTSIRLNGSTDTAEERKEQLIYAVNNSDGIVLDSDFEVAYPTTAGGGLRPDVEITKDFHIDLNGNTLKRNPVSESVNGVPAFFSITAAANVVVDGNGTIDTELGDNSCYGINVKHTDAVLTIKNGTFLGAPTAIQVTQGTLNVEGGFYDMAASCKAAAPAMAKYAINCIDKHFKDGTAKINITGGTFVNYDPSANPEGEGTTYVADGYKVESAAQPNGETWYTVVKA